MKKLLIAFSMVGAGALIACADTGAQSNSVTTNYAHDAWFSASASGTSLNAVGGKFSTIDGSASSFAAKEGKIEIDGDDVSDPVSFVLLNETTGKTTDLTRVTFELEASVVPFATLNDLNLEGAKTAFALVASTDKATTNFQAWVKQDDKFGWQALALAIPDVDAPYDLTMRFDDSAEAKKVQFAVKLEGQTSEEVSDWYTYGGLDTDSKPQINFVGCGKLKSMNADQVWIVSSKVVIEGGGSVTIDDKDMGAMNKLVGGGTIEDVLAADVSTKFNGATGTGPAIAASCKLNVAEAYAIGLITNANDTMVAAADGTFKMKADATANVDDDKIAIKFVTELTPADPYATVTYSLLGQKTAGGAWEPIKDAQNKSALSDVAIPTSAVTEEYRYFKVVTKVQLKN